jgi:MFS family permease
LIAARIGRRGAMLAGVATMLVAAGLLAAWKDLPALLVGRFLTGVAPVPERGTPTPRVATENRPAGSRRSVRLPVPAAAATIAAFSSTGLFAGLSGLFLATTFHRPSHALSGATLFLVFSAGVVSQLATTRLRASRVLALGMIFMVVRLRHPRSAGRLRLGLGAAGTPTRRLGLNQLPEPVTPPPQAAPRLIQRGDLLASPLIKNQMKASLT